MLSPSGLMPVLREDLKLQIVLEFNLPPSGYDPVYLTKAMQAFSTAISNDVLGHISASGVVNPAKSSDPLYIELPASGGGMTKYYVQGLGGID